MEAFKQEYCFSRRAESVFTKLHFGYVCTESWLKYNEPKSVRSANLNLVQ